MANLRPFRDYDEKDVINLFALDTSSLHSSHDLSTYDKRVKKGTLVTVNATGWNGGMELDMIESAGSFTVSGVTSERYGVKAKVTVSAAQDRPIGMLLFDVATHDENLEQLKYNPRKASELEAVIPGQAVPIVTRGMFLYESAALAAETFDAGDILTVGSNGELTTAGFTAGTDTEVGRALGAPVTGSDLVLIRLDL